MGSVKKKRSMNLFLHTPAEQRWRNNSERERVVENTIFGSAREPQFLIQPKVSAGTRIHKRDGRRFVLKMFKCVVNIRSIEFSVAFNVNVLRGCGDICAEMLSFELPA